MAIYLPQQPSFMDQFLGTGVMNNVMQAMMMRMQNQRADKEYAQGLQEKGYTEIQDPSTYKADEYIDTTPKTLPMPRQTGPQQWVPPQKPDVTVGGGRGLMGTPKRGFKRPAVPETTFGTTQGTGGNDWDVVWKDGKVFKAARSKAPTGGGFKDKTRTFQRYNTKTKKMETWAQDYDINKTTRERIKVGPEYRTKVGGDTNVTTNLKMSAASERDKLATAGASLANLDNMKSLYDKAFVGPVAGRIGKVGDIFGVNTESRSEFYAATSAFKNQIIKEITGAQMSEPEAKRIMKQVPDVNDPPTVWVAKWKQSKRNVAVLRAKRIEIMRKSGVLTPDISTEIPTDDDPFQFNNQFAE